jgi:hypothetical protein
MRITYIEDGYISEGDEKFICIDQACSETIAHGKITLTPLQPRKQPTAAF